MEYITLNNGVKMPKVGFGTVGIEGEECVKAVISAAEVGYRMFDTSPMYNNVPEVGKGLAECGVPREELFICTKLNSPYRSYEKAVAGIEEALVDLRTDYIDLFLIHEPYDEAVEMYKALEEAYEAGKIRAIGISNFNRKRYDDFLTKVKVVPVINQVECNVGFEQLDFIDYMESKGTHGEAWSPLGHGDLGINENEILIEIGKKYGKTPAQVALRYTTQNNIPVIPKSTHKERQKVNLENFDFTLTKKDMEKIATLDRGHTNIDWMIEWNEGWE